MAEEPKTRSDQITVEMAAQLLMISAERVRQISKAGYISIPRRGHTTIVSAVQGYIRFLKDDERRGSKAQAASRATDARASEIELRIAERKRELIPLEDAMLAMDRLVAVVNKELDGQPARITRDMPLRKLIEADVYGAKTRIATALGQSRGYAGTGRDADPAGAADGA